MINEQFNSGRRTRYRHTKKGRVLAGFFFLLIGVVLLMKQMGYYFPEWLFAWPMILILIGIFSGFKHNFRGGGWLVMLFIGSVFLIDHIYRHDSFHRYIWPIALIAVGAVIIFRPRSCRKHQWNRSDNRQEPIQNPSVQEGGDFAAEDFIDITSVFGGVKKIVVSKNFKGADVTCFMGGAEINLVQADIQGTARIDVTNIFGGTKLIVPSTWEVKSEASAIFGGVDDKRELHMIKPEPGKTLILDGSCIFGGIEIRSY